MTQLAGRVAVVTGASAGIGAAIAYQLQDAGLNVVALARRKEIVQSAVEEARREAQERGQVSLRTAPSPGQLHTLKCDVSKEDDVLAAFKWVKDNLNTVHILVNNAGASGTWDSEEFNTAEIKSMYDTNVLGLSLCTREAVQLMKATGVDDGHIIHIGSISPDDYMHMPIVAAYVASKTALRVLAEGLRRELVTAKSKIRVTEVRPGYVKKGSVSADTPSEITSGQPFLRPEDIADAVLYAVSAPEHVQIHTIIVRPVGETF